jgi:hypothetical protein
VIAETASDGQLIIKISIQYQLSAGKSDGYCGVSSLGAFSMNRILQSFKKSPISLPILVMKILFCNANHHISQTIHEHTAIVKNPLKINFN